MSPKLLCLGEPMMEFNQQSDGRYLAGHGGDVSNCAIAAARQEASAGIATRLGADPFGDSFMRLWDEEGVDRSSVRQVRDAHTGIYFVTHGPDGHEFTYMRAGSAASRMGPEDLPVALLKSVRILHVSGISQAISPVAADAVFAAIQIVRDSGGSVSYDPNLRLRLWPIERARAITHATLAQCDYALPGLDDARQLTGLHEPDDVLDRYLSLGAGMVALTMGAVGTRVATPSERRHIPAHSVATVDATAAGDTFDGAFLARIVLGDDPFDAARYANAAAALSTRGFGAVAPIPRKPEVEAFLAKESARHGPEGDGLS